MTGRELILELLKGDIDKEVILQRDSEGNGYESLRIVDSNAIQTDDGDVYSAEWTAQEACMYPEEWEEFKQKPRCIVLAP